MERHERLDALLDLVLERGTIRIEEIVETLGISAATARRDLDYLAHQQLLVRTHGGATTNPTSADMPIRYRTSMQQAGIQRIARAAAELITPGDVVGLNGGATTTEVARALIDQISSETDNPDSKVVIVTNAVNIANEMAIRKHVRLVLTGGVVQPMTYELVGPLSMRILDEIVIDTMFLGVNAINETGAYTHDDAEAAINAALVSRAQRVVVVAVASKLSARAFVKICDSSKIDMVITEKDVDPAAARLLERAGVEVRAV